MQSKLTLSLAMTDVSEAVEFMESDKQEREHAVFKDADTHTQRHTRTAFPWGFNKKYRRVKLGSLSQYVGH